MLAVLPHAIDPLWRNENVADDLDDTICGNSILNVDSGKSIDFDFNQAAISCNIDGKRLAFQEGWEVDLSCYQLICNE